MRKSEWASIALALALVVAPVGLSAQQGGGQGNLEAVARSLNPQHGVIPLPDAKATLNLGNDYDFYTADDARKILVDLWGNPPGSAKGVMGLVMQAGQSPLSDAWGAVITYDPSGYVADNDAASVDYDELLEQMRSDEDEVNEQRKSEGYPAIHLTGWAEQPNYDKASHSVVWAQEIEFAGSANHSLNYDVRSLGRNGVLSVNLVSSMPHLAEVKGAAHEFASHASFDDGFRYADFDPNLDKKAEYGVAGLVAAGVGVAAAKKLGLLAVLLKFLKPILIAVVAGFAAFKNRILALFGRNKDPLEGE